MKKQQLKKFAEPYRTIDGLTNEDVFRTFFRKLIIQALAEQYPEQIVFQGGTALLLRLPAARYTKDIDADISTSLSEDELLSFFDDLSSNPHHPLTYKVRRRGAMGRNKNGYNWEILPFLEGKLSTRIKLDINHVDQLEFDIIHEPSVIFEEKQQPHTVAIPIQTVASSLANKIAAAFTTHSFEGKTFFKHRYHDLADIVLLTRNLSVDNHVLVKALKEVEADDDDCHLPSKFTYVDPDLTPDSWEKSLKRRHLPQEGFELDSVLKEIGRFIDPILKNLHTNATPRYIWTPERQKWHPAVTKPTNKPVIERLESKDVASLLAEQLRQSSNSTHHQHAERKRTDGRIRNRRVL